MAVLILDTLVVPADLSPGEYVLGWRWDCEESTQVWTSCSDVVMCAGADDHDAGGYPRFYAQPLG